MLKRNSQSEIEITNQDLNISIRPYIDGEDEGIRCIIQNMIFQSKSREMLTVDDIFTDTFQDYYIKDMSYFICINDIPIGFGQIIFSEDIYTLVNFGIIPEFRGHKLSKVLLNEIILSCKEKGIKLITLKVDTKNEQAISLYSKAGFNKKYNVSSFNRLN